MELEKSPFCRCLGNNWFRQDSPRCAKITKIKRLIKIKNILHRLIGSQHKLLINYKGKFTVWKSARHHLNQANKVNRNDNGTNYYCLPSSAILWEGSITSVMLLPKMHTLNEVMKQFQTDPNWGTFCKMLLNAK